MAKIENLLPKPNKPLSQLDSDGQSNRANAAAIAAPEPVAEADKKAAVDPQVQAASRILALVTNGRNIEELMKGAPVGKSKSESAGGKEGLGDLDVEALFSLVQAMDKKRRADEAAQKKAGGNGGGSGGPANAQALPANAQALPEQSPAQQKTLADVEQRITDGGSLAGHLAAKQAKVDTAEKAVPKDDPLRKLSDQALEKREPATAANELTRRAARAELDVAKAKVELIKQGHAQLSEGKLTSAEKRSMAEQQKNLPVLQERADKLAALAQKAREPSVDVGKPEGKPLAQPDANTLNKPQAKPLAQPDANTLNKPQAKPQANAEENVVDKPVVDGKPAVDGKPVVEVKIGDVLSRIAAAHKNSDGTTVTVAQLKAQPENKAIFDRNAKGDLIRPGDKVTLPLGAVPRADAKPPAVVEPKPPVVVEPKPPVVVEPKPPVVVEPKPPVVVEPKPPVVVDPKPPVHVEPKPPVLVEPKPPVLVEPKPPVRVEPKPPVLVEPKPPVLVEPKPPVLVEPKPPVLVEPKPPVIVEPKPPVIVEPKPPVIVEPKPEPKPAVMAQRYETAGSTTDKDAVAARTLAQLKEGGVVPKDTKLSTALPADVQQRVDSDPELKGAKTYGDMMKGLIGDGDKNGKLDVDALQLQRALPGSSQQKIMSALTKEPADLKAKLKDVGLDDAKATSIAGNKDLKLTDPKSFGLAGKTELDKAQQQTMLRNGMLLDDVNKDGKLDNDDQVSFVDPSGDIKKVKFGDLDKSVQDGVKLSIATAKAAEDYDRRPTSEKVLFPSLRADGRADPERVNKDLWEIDKTGGPSWKLKDGVTPDKAVTDPFNGNGAAYTTECAQARAMMRLKGMHDHLVKEHGEGEGKLRFNAQFAKTPEDQKKATDYLAKLDQFKKDNPGKSFEDFQKANKQPEIKFGLEVSRHTVKDAAGERVDPFQPYRGGEAAPGDPGYFHNHSVTPLGVRIGYVGENVLDTGFKKDAAGNVERNFWGHPGGVKAEHLWQEELDAKFADGTTLQAKQMKDYGQYFDSKQTAISVRNWGEHNVEVKQDAIDKLKADKPADWEAKVKTLEKEQQEVRSTASAYQAFTSAVDPSKADALQTFLRSNPTIAKAADTKPLLDAMTPDGKTALARSFDELPADTQTALAKELGGELKKLTPDQKAQAALLVHAQAGGSLDPEVRESLTTNIRNQKANEWLGGDGKLATTANAQKWLSSPEFKTWYAKEFGTEFKGTTDLKAMDKASVQAIIEKAIPSTAALYTAYGDMIKDYDAGAQKLSDQMASLLKDGKLKPADYRPDGG